jgi:peptidoglycan/LPS O-acetylase OafA/YrhL
MTANKDLKLLHPKYRPDIDGLRAIAVLSVLGFHAFPEWVHGGFIGVDIFFVISGYLISTIIFENLEKNSFSFIDFYRRRIRRIFPALLIVLVSCFVFGWFSLTPREFSQLGKHIASGATFISNFSLWRESGYFDNLAETKPLLHLWSLGIEEQFYIIWPLLLWMAWKLRINFLIAALLLCSVSFYQNISSISHDPVATFYHPGTRFWELLIGSILAYLILYAGERVKRLQSYGAWLSGLGLILIGISIAFLNKTSLFPGWCALLPTIGAALIIFSSPKSLFNKSVLSNKLLIWFGLISFPLYLWHWPLLSLIRIMESQTPSITLRIFAVALSILLASLTYYFVEKPIRFGRHIKTMMLAGGIATIGILGYLSSKHEGFEFRFNKPPLEIRSGEYACKHNQQTTGKPCEFGNLDSKKIILVYGDSQSGHLTNALNETFGKEYKLVFFGHGGCFIGNGDGSPICELFRQEVGKFKNQDVYAVARSQRWSRFGAIDEKSTKNLILDAIDSSLELNPKKIIIVGSIEDINAECEFANYYIPFRRRNCGFDVESSRLNRLFISTSKKIASPKNLYFVYPYEKICENENCAVINGSKSNYSDGAHLSTDGALLLMPNFIDILNN